MMIAYTVLGKIGMIEVRGPLPRVGDILVYPGEAGAYSRFWVREVQIPLQASTSHNIYNTGMPQVYVDLVD
jgi:hypothetical protein